MRILISILILIFSFQSLTKADDIRNFEIEGMSIGDSLLDYFSENEIRKSLNDKLTYPSSDKFVIIDFNIQLEKYDAITFHVKKNDKKFIIYEIAAIKDFKNNIEDCYKLSDEISKEVEKIYIDTAKLPYEKKHAGDKTGKSINKGYDFDFESGDYINIACYDWSKKIENERNWADHLRVGLVTNELSVWLSNEAY